MSPLKMFEYMATNNPIVTTDLPCIRDVLSEKNAVLFAPNDLNNLTDSLERLIKDKDLSRRLSEQALSDVSEYTWDKRAKEILNFMNSRLWKK